MVCPWCSYAPISFRALAERDLPLRRASDRRPIGRDRGFEVIDAGDVLRLRDGPPGAGEEVGGENVSRDSRVCYRLRWGEWRFPRGSSERLYLEPGVRLP
jgi:hypothetical protein